jgi:hypothetical protein
VDWDAAMSTMGVVVKAHPSVLTVVAERESSLGRDVLLPLASDVPYLRPVLCNRLVGDVH